MSIDWSDLIKVAGDGGFTVLPNGEYDVYINNTDAGKTSTAKDRIRINFRVETGPYAGQIISNDFVITPDNANAMSIFFRNMTALGLGASWFAANPAAPLSRVAEELATKRTRCRLRVSTRSWQGQDRNNVDAILPALPGTAVSAPPAPSSVPAVAPASVPQTQAAGRNQPVPTVPNLPDDLPF